MANVTIGGKDYDVVPDITLPDTTHIDGCWECDLAKVCEPLTMFCKEYMYMVHFKMIQQ